MRDQLKTVNGKRIVVFGIVGRFGKKSAYKGPPIQTICLIDLVDKNNVPVCDHIWIVVGKQVAGLNLSVGDKICFEGRVKEYWKGYKGNRDDVYSLVTKDYKLSNPTKFLKLNTDNAPIPGTLL